MSVYQTEEEQVESIKRWWKENGMSVVAGIVIGLGGVFGWQAWTGYQDSIRQQASSAFEQLMAAAGQQQTDSAVKQAELMAQEFPNTPYPALGALVAAKIQYEQGNEAAAKTALQGVIEDAPDAALAQIAVLRLARILLDEGDPAAAASLLQQHPASASFAGDYAALRGDIALAEGNASAARQAYQEALDKNAANAALIQLKLDNLQPTS